MANTSKVAHPVHCGRPMVVNSRINRVSGPRIVYRCPVCGTTKTIKEGAA